MMNRMYVLVIFCLLFSLIEAYKPVVLVHGIFSTGNELNDLKNLIQNEHPATKVYIFKYVKNERDTLKQLPNQLKNVIKLIKPIIEDNLDGVHMVCHSQGGLLCLGIVEYLRKHNVHSFISLSAPLFGQFGLPDTLVKKIAILKPIKNLREVTSDFMFTHLLQDLLSVANYWKDPRELQYKKYLQSSNYLPIILNDPNSSYYNEKDAAVRKSNFLKIKQMVLVGGPQDGTIIPWQSSMFGFYDNDTAHIKDIYDQEVFKDDWFGLKTLNDSNRLHLYRFNNVKHDDWYSNKNVFDNAIRPWLD